MSYALQKLSRLRKITPSTKCITACIEAVLALLQQHALTVYIKSILLHRRLSQYCPLLNILKCYLQCPTRSIALCIALSHALDVKSIILVCVCVQGLVLSGGQ